MSQQQSFPSGRPSNSLHFVVGEMSGKLDRVLAAIITDKAETARRLGEHELRLEVLESLRWKAAGGGAVLVFLITAVEVWRGAGR